jgi:hypothetical protein
VPDTRKPRVFSLSGLSANRKDANLPRFLVGSSGRTRTYNPAVNSRMLYH